MSPIEKRFIQDRNARLQYITLSRAVATNELPEELRAQYAPYKRDGFRVNALIRFDDDCKNGHCTLSITGDTKECGGQIPELLAFVFPEIAHALPWHLVSTDGPLHYVANTIYHASNRDHYGRAKGDVSAYEYGIRFNGVPVTHRVRESFWQFLRSRVGTGEFTISEFAHEREPQTFKPHYSVTGYASKWHECPFSDRTQAEEFITALNTCSVEFVRVPTAWSDGKERELDHARSCAIWPEATDERLSVPADELRAILLARLPDLMTRFRAVVESLGFDYDFPAHTRRGSAA